MKRALLIAALVTGCVIKDPGYSLFLGSNIAPSQPPTCTYEATSTTIIPYGVLDANIAKARCLTDTSIPCYLYNPSLKNQMHSIASGGVGFGNESEVRADANNVVIEGFYMTYEVTDTPHVDTDSGDIPGATTLFVGSNVAVIPPGGISATGVDLIPATELQALFDANPSLNFRIYVHARATSRTQDGRTIGSNEVLYMVDVCPACLSSCPKGFTVDTTKVCILGQDASVGCTAPTTAGP